MRVRCVPEARRGTLASRRLPLLAVLLALPQLVLPQLAHGQRRESPVLDPGAVSALASPRAVTAGVTLPLAADTGRRPVAIEYSDWYARRLRVHQLASWAMLPLFAVQYAAGQQLLDKGEDGAPSWARNLHSPLAGATGVLFGVNTITGTWNLWDARKDSAGRKWRTAHSILMLVADAGFAITPSFAEDDDDEGGGRSSLRTHRNWAIGSMGIAAASWIMMLPPFRRE
jgi:hypothetical protein